VGKSSLKTGQEIAAGRNLPARMGFQRIWLPWCWTIRPWERVRFLGRTQDRKFMQTDGRLDPASDAAIMLRVAAGDESGFNYLLGSTTGP